MSDFQTVLKKAIRNISDLFGKASQDFNDIMLEDWIQDMVGQTVGDKRIYEFLEKCFIVANGGLF